MRVRQQSDSIVHTPHTLQSQTAVRGEQTGSLWRPFVGQRGAKHPVIPGTHHCLRLTRGAKHLIIPDMPPASQDRAKPQGCTIWTEY
ncbi:hypothetical protein SRHO_G00309630 [Serrasalmus rhombeus]